MLSTESGMRVLAEVQSGMQTKLNLITKHATEDKKFVFTSLAHLLNEDSLKECFKMLHKNKAPGIDEVTYKEYEASLNVNIMKLVKRMKAMQYRPQPVKRVYIPKENGKMRPLGIPALEDKIVQMGITRILEAIFEPSFLDCSFGFRTGKNCHQALDRIDKSIMTKPVNYVIDADIKGFFDNVEHEWLMKMLQERINDRNFLRIIKRFLKAGIIEEGVAIQSEEGVPQGGILSPCLSNIYLHYVLDLWVEKKVKSEISGYVEEIRYCDDFVILVQYKEEAEQIMEKLEERLNKFGLELAKDKTRLIEFGRYARMNAEKRGGKPETFDFLGFTHYCDVSRKGNFKVGRKTKRKKFSAKLKEINQWLKSIRNLLGLKDWWKTLQAKLRGHIEYFGVSGNMVYLRKFCNRVSRLAFKWINRRSQKKSMTMKQYLAYIGKYPLPKPVIRHNFYTLYCNK